MPPLVNNNAGSLAGTSEELRTTVCPRSAKKSRKRCLISEPVTLESFWKWMKFNCSCGRGFLARGQCGKVGLENLRFAAIAIISSAMRISRAILALLAAFVTAGLAPQSLCAQAADAKTAEQVFKNITQLKGTPADQLQPAMQFIAASLGVECTFCHVQGKMEADDKPAKKTARDMMAMTLAINANSFRGQKQVTCYSCHRGSTRPVNMPPVLESDAPTAAAAAAPGATQAAAPTVDQILEKYVTAVGGADAMKKVASRVMTGKILTGTTETPIELFTKAPNMRVSVSHSNGSDSFTAFDGTAGWMGSTGHAAREMTAAESAASGLDAEFYLPLRIKELYPQLRRGRPET